MLKNNVLLNWIALLFVIILQCKENFLAHTLSLDIDQPRIKSSSVFHGKIEREKDFPRT